MKRLLLHIILFVPLCLLFIVLMLWLLGGTGRVRNVTYHLGHEDHLHSKVQEALDARPIDVLFLGSSHAYRTFDPRLFARHGVRVFNLGSSMQTPLQTEVLIDKWLDSMRPKLVVFEVHPDVMQHDGVEPAVYQLCNLQPTWQMVPMMLRTVNRRVFCTGVYAMLHNRFSDDFARYADPVDCGVNHYVEGGYVERDLECYSPVPHHGDTIRVRGVQRRALRRCVDKLQGRGIHYILLQVPDTKVLLDSYSNLAEFQAEMSGYGKYCFMSSPLLDDSLHFFNEDHLNQRGVELYDSLVCSQLIIPILDSL